MTHYTVIDGPSPWTHKYAWSCPQAGCFSGYRFKTHDNARRAGDKHTVEATVRDNQLHQRMYGGKR